MESRKAHPQGLRRARIALHVALGALVAAVLALPVGCVAAWSAIDALALVLTLARLFNWQLWVWLLELTAFVVYLFAYNDSNEYVLILLLWSGLVSFVVGFTLLLRKAMAERAAMSLGPMPVN